MNPARFWRTARHLAAKQVFHRVLVRGRRMALGAFPGAARNRLMRAAALPPPDPTRAGLAAAAEPVASLQTAVHGADAGGIAAGRFHLLNREFDFGSPGNIDWRGDFFEGGNPLRRMTLSYMGYAVPLLARGRAADAETVVAVLSSLEAGNRFAVPGVLGDVWSPYAASHRLINLLAGLALYRRTGNTPPAEAEAAILDHVRLCAALVRADLERDLGYNHLMKNLTALAFYCAALPAVPPDFAFLRDAVPACLEQCVLGDGGHAERSPMYHLLAMLDLDVLGASGLFPDDWGALLQRTRQRMATALAVMTHPDGDIALFNDAWIGEAPPAGDLIDIPAAPGAARLPETGYVRLGEAGDALLFDCGPCGPDDNPAHAHADFLSIELSVAGRRLIVDPGVATYSAGDARDITRSAASHNGPHLKGIEPIEFWKSFRVGRRGRAHEITDPALEGIAPLWAAGTHDGYDHVGLRVCRYVGLWPGKAALVCDLWLGPRRAREASGFLVPEGWVPEAGLPANFLSDAGRVAFSALAGGIGGASPARCWRRFGVEEPAHRVTMTPDDAADARRAALWIAWGQDAVPPDEGILGNLFRRLKFV